MKIGAEKMEWLIDRYSIKPALQRDCSFLGHSIIGAVYVKDLKEFAGFGYGAVGAIWWNGIWQSMTNNDEITDKVRKSIGCTGGTLRGIRTKSMALYRKRREEFEALKKYSSVSPLEIIKQAARIYRDYLVSLGFYNALMRFVGDRDPWSLGIEQQDWKEIGNERNESASLYNDIEQFIKGRCVAAGEEIGVDGNLLRFLTLDELLTVSVGRKPSQNLLREAKEREKQYFYLITDENELSEYVVSDRDSVAHIYDKYFKVKNEGEIKGIVAFPGNVQGEVVILSPDADPSKVNVSDTNILVAVHTHPRYTELIKKSLAIVTDEGGTLSHAAITARELKKPCIIGTKIATKVLKNGDSVEVNANDGVVKIIRKSN